MHVSRLRIASPGRQPRTDSVKWERVLAAALCKEPLPRGADLTNAWSKNRRFSVVHGRVPLNLGMRERPAPWAKSPHAC